jgi:hypothetical protein
MSTSTSTLGSYVEGNFKFTPCNLSVLVGQTLESATQVSMAPQIGECVAFVSTTGAHYIMFHRQEGSECVVIEDVDGDLSTLLGSPIIKSEEQYSSQPFKGRHPNGRSFAWTFYEFVTIRGRVNVRWFSESDGSCSEEISFVQFEPIKT